MRPTPRVAATLWVIESEVLMIHEEPKYDVAISFLTEDITLATALNDKLSIGLEVFFFPRKQEELAGTDGMESMREPFVSQSRINVVLYREKWGETPWTGVEAAAIKESCCAKAYRNLFFFVVKPTNRIPRWIPDTHIRFNYGEFSLDDAVGAIKARVVEQGGHYKPLTPMRRAEIFKADEEYRYDKMRMNSTDGLQAIRASVKELFTLINDQCQTIKNQGQLEIDCGIKWNERDAEQFCVLTSGRVGMNVNWYQPSPNSLEKCVLRFREFPERLQIPGECMQRFYMMPSEPIRETAFVSDLSRAREYGWKEERKEDFIPNQVLAERCVTEFIDLIDRDATGKVLRRSPYQETRRLGRGRAKGWIWQ
jgi:hypothetical protein